MRKFLAIVLALTLAVAFNTPAQATGAEGWCVALGGNWNESDATHATCIFPSGSDGFNEHVGDGYCEADASEVVLNYEKIAGDWHQTSLECRTWGGEIGETAPPYGPYGNEVTDPEDTTVCLAGGMNGCVTFGGALHTHKCLISNMLPRPIQSSVPNGTVATLYVRIPEGQTELDSHTICFSTDGIENPVLYQYVAGEWVTVNTGGYGGLICTTHSGDGSFALAGN